jgi:2-methylisocitrate lyase-like PEP mutase family enzyme
MSNVPALNRSQRLRQLLASKETLVMPDAYDPISARIIERAGFKAVQCSGYSFSVAACRQHELDLGLEENLSNTARIIDAVSLPVMADGEDGFGGVEQIPNSIARYLSIGTAGINLEDQVLDRKPGTRVIDCALMQEKIRAARNTAQSAGNPDFVINGRTDALKAFPERQAGLREAIRRGNLYLQAGADIVFVTAVSSLAEAKDLVEQIKGPLSIAAGLAYNLHAFSINDLRQLGVARVSLPSLAICAAIQALRETMAALNSGSFTTLTRDDLLCSPDDIQRLLGP